jgi:hypothetical protein
MRTKTTTNRMSTKTTKTATARKKATATKTIARKKATTTRKSVVAKKKATTKKVDFQIGFTNDIYKVGVRASVYANVRLVSGM